ncbi:MAG: riboflavin synthase [Phycisphaerae bacterium]|nr:riboflavin synthase [Phycisphaerae bacterium]
MFTGIVQHVGVVRNVSPDGAGRRLRLDLGPLARVLKPGDSVAVNGLCLTAGAIAPPTAEFDVVAESLSRSTLGTLAPGDSVNLEPALSAEGRFDGHIVQGHVDGQATVKRTSIAQPWIAEFTAAREIVDQMVPKGSVAIDGVSLTLAGVEADTFRVALIPTTLAKTTLAKLTVGDRVNLEVDILGKYIRRYLQQMLGDGESAATTGLTLEKLKTAGFM